MKKNIYLILFLAVTVFMSCEDKENYGTPVIDSIKQSVKVTETVNGNSVDVMRDQDMDHGELGDWIFIDGSNFYDVNEIIFNDVPVSMSSAYVTPNRISVCIPRYAPKEITNKITVTTAHGIASKDFPIDIPVLSIAGLLNEYAKPGTTGYITGENFDIYQLDSTKGAWLEIDGKELGVTMVNSKQLSFKIPKDMKPGADIHIYRTDKEGQLVVDKKVPGYYMDSRYMFFDFTAIPGHYKMEVTNGLGKVGYPDSISGNYAVFVGDYPRNNWGGKWYFEDGMPIREYACFKGNYMDLVGDASKLQLVFEVNVPKDWANIPMIITYNDYWYRWRPHTGVSFKTSDWITVRIPLKEFKDKEGTGVPWNKFTEAMATNWGACYRRVLLNGPTDQNDIFICIDNIRFAPIE